MILYQVMVEDQKNECEIALAVYKHKNHALEIANQMNDKYRRYAISTMRAYVTERIYIEN